MGRDAYMRGKNLISEEASTVLLFEEKKESQIDDRTFDIWKSELQKELPSFWEEMIHRPRWR